MELKFKQFFLVYCLQFWECKDNQCERIGGTIFGGSSVKSVSLRKTKRNYEFTIEPPISRCIAFNTADVYCRIKATKKRHQYLKQALANTLKKVDIKDSLKIIENEDDNLPNEKEEEK